MRQSHVFIVRLPQVCFQKIKNLKIQDLKKDFVALKRIYLKVIKNHNSKKIL